jgi:succinate dehydrogenase flavin-adding protein (antitoxin of CptAB toxin-antitoxin module)
MSGYEHMYYNMLNRKEFNEYRLTLDEEDDSIEANFKQSKEVKQYQLNKTNRLNHSQDKLDRIIPSI